MHGGGGPVPGRGVRWPVNARVGQYVKWGGMYVHDIGGLYLSGLLGGSGSSCCGHVSGAEAGGVGVVVAAHLT